MFIYSSHCGWKVRKTWNRSVTWWWINLFGYTSGPQAGRIRKDLTKIFKEDFDLSITFKTNLKGVILLDVTLNLWNAKYQPKTSLLYINILYNHPQIIIKNLPGNISKRINTLSADETRFNKFEELYNALAKSGFKIDLQVDLHFSNNDIYP